MNPVLATAFPRAGILGNPSDLYGGRGIGFTFEDFRATVTLQNGRFDPDNEAPILQAARAVLPELGISEDQQHGFALSFESDIPRQVGLSGSSAIVIAALRTVIDCFELDCTPPRLAALALRAETEHMGITAGPMDRIIQAHEGLLAMDFANDAVERLDPALLPPLLILMDRSPGQDSGAVHAPVRDRWEAGDPILHEVMAAYRPLVERGRACLESGDVPGLMACVNENFDLRARAFPIGRRDRAVIDLVRASGAAAKFCGSGGAILAMHRDADGLELLRPRAAALGYAAVRPMITGARS